MKSKTTKKQNGKLALPKAKNMISFVSVQELVGRISKKGDGEKQGGVSFTD